MTPVLVGIDSGGTRTSVRIRTREATHGFELAESLSGSMAPTEHAGTLRAILRATEDRLPQEATEGRIAVFVGAAGFTPALRDDFRVALGEAAPAVMSGRISSIGIANDATTLLLGHHADAIVIAGTGSNVLVRSSEGAVSQVGGQEWVVADQGSGFWIGLRGIRRAYGDHESGARTVLLHRLRQAYDVPAGDDARLVATVRDLAIADAGMKRRIARFAAAVCSAAEDGDEASRDIVRAEAEELADALAGPLRTRVAVDDPAGALSVVECGGLLGNAFYQRAFRSRVEARLGSGGRPVAVDWRHVTTGLDAALNLAGEVDGRTRDLSTIEPAYRPLVVRFD